MRIYGVDFTCAPRRAKPITAAIALLKGKSLRVSEIEALSSFAQFESLLARPGPWVGGFDFPFALPLELLRDLQWPLGWKSAVARASQLSRAQLRNTLDAYRATRPPGRKYAHRATDLPAGSSSPMKLVNPPVALMFHEGAPRLLASGVHLPALADGDRSRVALEAYPGLLVRRQLGLRASYKSDTRAGQTRERRLARKRIVEALEEAKPLGIKVLMDNALKSRVLADGTGDLLDAIICAVQAAWASSQPQFGLPPVAFAGEGWIISA
ncbi:MAG: DUF429 domain-containing protein [Betaproteobacteria bacterium]|nr:DUF429 domain-containing protein [Betaproteobacteria bacterium]